MNKHLKAEKVSDGYVVTITEVHRVSLIQDVHAIARYNGLIVDNQESVYGNVYAD